MSEREVTIQRCSEESLFRRFSEKPQKNTSDGYNFCKPAICPHDHEKYTPSRVLF